MTEPQLLDRLRKTHIRWTYTQNGQVLPVKSFRDPNTGNLPGQFEQCQHCKTEWPCETRQLLDIIDNLVVSPS